MDLEFPMIHMNEAFRFLWLVNEIENDCNFKKLESAKRKKSAIKESITTSLKWFENGTYSYLNLVCRMALEKNCDFILTQDTG